MAVAGGATVAYKCRVIDNILYDSQTTYPSSMCEDVDSAIEKISTGETVIVSGANKHQLNQKLKEMGVSLSVNKAIADGTE